MGEHVAQTSSWPRSRPQALIGSTYVPGYGLAATIATTHMNSPDAKHRCLGIPTFNADSRALIEHAQRRVRCAAALGNGQGELQERIFSGMDGFDSMYWPMKQNQGGHYGD